MSRRVRLLTFLMRTGCFEKSGEAEALIRKGKVLVNGLPATDPKYKVRLSAKVEVSGKIVKPADPFYLILDKPRGLECQKGQSSVYSMLKELPIPPKIRKSLFCVGRLDKDSTGLLIFTNDGSLEKKLTKEREVPKTYLVETSKPIQGLERLEEGIEIKDPDTGRSFFVKALDCKKLGEKKAELSILEGRKRQVKRMFSAIGNEVTGLRRTGIGNLKIAGIGKFRIVSQKEIKKMIFGKDL